MKLARGVRLALCALALVGVGGRSGAAPDAPGGLPPELASEPNACDTCRPPDGASILELTEARIDSIGRTLSRHNLELWSRTDSLYRSAAFGPVGSEEARERAGLHFMLRAWSGMDYLAQLTDRGIYARSEECAMLRPFGETYANTSVYPLRFLREAWTGPGGFCMEYDLGERFDERMPVGGISVRVRSDRIRAEDGSLSPAICLEMGSSLHKSVDLLYGARYCGRVRRQMIVDRSDTLDLVTMYDVEGLFARKAGTHHLTAVVVWRSRVQGDRDPERPRVGACAYFPRIQLRLSLLPDLGLDDLREFDVPQPVLPTAWTERELRRDWIRVRPGAVFTPWEAIGPRPAILAERFPDL